MKNLILLLYNLDITDIKKIYNNYYFTYQNSNFIVMEYKRDLKQIESLYKLNKEMLKLGYPVHEIIITRDYNIIFEYDGKNYALMRLNIKENRLITIKDIISFNCIINSQILNDLDNTNWPKYWEKKIDYIEYQFNEVKENYKIINESINYYIGIWENAISYYNDNFNDINIKKVICHKRLNTNTTLIDFYNPLEYVIDYKMRDIGEYLKSYVLDKNFTITEINNILNKLNLSYSNIILLISRVMFPSLYFDQYEKIIIDHEEEETIKEIIKKHDNYHALIKTIFKKYLNYNIPIIYWILKN